MSYRTNGKTTNFNVPVSLGMGFVFAWVIMIVMGAVTAFMIAGERIPEDFLDPAAVIVLCVSSFVSAMAAGGAAEGKRMFVCVLSGGIYYLSLICCNILLFNGCFHGLLGAALTIIGCCVIAGLIQTRQRKPRNAYYKDG